jgi:hypothetical protein
MGSWCLAGFIDEAGNTQTIQQAPTQRFGYPSSPAGRIPQWLIPVTLGSCEFSVRSQFF